MTYYLEEGGRTERRGGGCRNKFLIDAVHHPKRPLAQMQLGHKLQDDDHWQLFAN